jgi:UDP-glucose 4-epimerase
MERAWVTGAKGFIGRHLARRLAANGATVAGIGHGIWVEEHALPWGVSIWINGDVSQANLDRLARRADLPQVIFHVAGGSSVGLSLQTPEEDFRRSVESTLQLLEWVRNHAAETRVVLASSAAVYGGGYSRPIREDDLPSPYSPYGYHKRFSELLFESYARNFGVRTATLRLFSVYGPHLRKQLLWDLCSRLKTYPEVLRLAGTGDEQRDWFHVEDAAAYLAAIAQRASADGVVLNAGSGAGTSVRDIAGQVCAAWGHAPQLAFSGAGRPGDPACLVADVQRASAVGLRPSVEWRAGVGDYVAWFQRAEHTQADDAPSGQRG